MFGPHTPEMYNGPRSYIIEELDIGRKIANMATTKRKRSRRRSAGSTASRSQAGASSASSQQETGIQAAADTAGTDGSGEANIDLGAEYNYVRKDLRHLAIVSLGLFAVMLVIGFLI